MTLQVGDMIEYNAGKRSGRILAIDNNGKHALFKISNGDQLLDLHTKVGKPGGVRVLPQVKREEPPVDLVGGGLQVLNSDENKDDGKKWHPDVPLAGDPILDTTKAVTAARPSGSLDVSTGPSVSGISTTPKPSGV